MKTLFRLSMAAFGLAIFDVSTVVVQGQSYTNNYGIWGYATTNGTITITGYTGPGGSVVIPNTITGLPVISIGNYAFLGCTSLTNVTIGNSVTYMGDFAFQACTSLTSMTIPTSVTSIGDSPFYLCTSLAMITVDALNPAYSSVDGVLFDKTQTKLLTCPAGKAGTYTIPDSVTNIGTNAFAYCDNLTSITIPNSVTSIGDYAFQECSSLSRITISNSITDIGQGAFYGCSSLTSVTIGNNVTNIGDVAFFGCSKLRGVYFRGNAPGFGIAVFVFGGGPLSNWRPIAATIYYLPGTTGWGTNAGGWGINNYYALPTAFWDQPTQIGYRANGNTVTIKGYASGGALTIPDTIAGLPVTSIETNAFLWCTSLTNVIIPNSVTSMGSSAFEGTGLTSVTIPNSMTSIGDSAFSSCTSLTGIVVATNNPAYSTVDGVLFDKNQTTLLGYPGGKATRSYTIPKSVTSIETAAFSGCCSLTNLMIPNNVANIGDSAFYGCTGLISIKIPNGVSNVGSWAFWGCTSLSSITIPISVTNIGDYTFQGCSSLTSVTIPNRITSVGVGAFEGTGLTNVTIPNSVTSIEEGAFAGCTSLLSVSFEGNAPAVNPFAFSGDTSTVYYLQGTTGWDANFAGLPAMLWNPQVLTSEASFGVRTNQFGFMITATSNLVIVVEATTDLSSLTWSPLQTNTLASGSSYFSDPQWPNSTHRFYRLVPGGLPNVSPAPWPGIPK